MKKAPTVSVWTVEEQKEVLPNELRATLEDFRARYPTHRVTRRLRRAWGVGGNRYIVTASWKGEREGRKQLRATCQICQRLQAVSNGVIAEHGYRLRFYGASREGRCPGARFKPLDQSRDRLAWFVDMLAANVRELRAQIESTPPEVDRHGREFRRLESDLRYEESVAQQYREYFESWQEGKAPRKVVIV